jgi:hypothetical protein
VAAVALAGSAARVATWSMAHLPRTAAESMVRSPHGSVVNGPSITFTGGTSAPAALQPQYTTFPEKYSLTANNKPSKPIT